MSNKQYVDGYLLPVNRDKLETYKEVAELAGKVWIEHGALEYRENIIEQDDIPGFASFSKIVGADSGQVVLFSWAVFPSKAVRDAANEKIMNDSRLKGMEEVCSELFDCKKMAFGGFQTLVQKS